MADESAVPLSIAVPEALVLGLPPSDDPPDEVLELARDADVIAIGPGPDDIGRTTELIHVILGAAGEDWAVMLDAYARGALSRSAEAALTRNVTEAGHLLGRDPGEDLTAAASELAEVYQAVVSLYGHIADPDGSAWRKESGMSGWAPRAAGTRGPA